MRRALLAITGLAAGTTALVVLKGSPGATPVAAGELPAGPAAVPGQSAPATPGATRPPSARPTGTPTPKPSASRTPRPKPSASSGSKAATSAPRRTTAAPRTTTAAPPATNRKVTGPVVANEFGNVQVQITLSGTKIVNCLALELPSGGQSGQRSDRVDAAYSGTSGQVVQRQSASLDTVSGATYTSRSYQQSLQAAIDQAR
ncbi:FMN-binding protein [Micromonospora sp. NPDC050686]|uniref:FMN-binding protein n=1 Tax=Micromonospora sp. NPDC050686 TaxID=3154631 RepID=UPI0033F450DC